MNNRNKDPYYMSRACELAMLGQGSVEPNPPVGCVIVRGDKILAEGYHTGFGQSHAEVTALEKIPAGEKDELKQASLYVTLEPCCHHGKTPPCTEAILQSGIGRVVIAIPDPSPNVAGKGIEQLRKAGIKVEVGVSEDLVRQHLGPYLKFVEQGLPWIIAKWAMTLDGKIATRTTDSRWISTKESRRIAHELRGRVDGIMVGINTALADDPLLTARPAGPRTATRIVLDSTARLPVDSQLVRSVDQAPTLVLVGPQANEANARCLKNAGVELFYSTAPSPEDRLRELLEELGRRDMTTLLVEGGGAVLGSLFDSGSIDEVHAFIAPIIVGGTNAPTAVAGNGAIRISDASRLEDVTWRTIGSDQYVHGLVAFSK